MFYEQYPRMMMLELTRKCNLNCSYCNRNTVGLNLPDMKWETFVSIIKHIERIKSICLCGMGEQFLHPQIYGIIESLYDKEVYIISNGTVKMDHNRLNTYKQIKNITLSVDGHNEEIIKRSCSGYVFSNLKYNLEQLKECEHIHTAINYVISPNNVDSTMEMVDFCKEYGIDSFNLLTPSSNKNWIIEKEKKLKAINIQLKEAFEEIGIEYLGLGRHQCNYQESVIPYIDAEGALRTCCSHSGYVPYIGSVKTTDFDQLFSRQRYDKFKSGVFCEKCNDFNTITV